MLTALANRSVLDDVLTSLEIAHANMDGKILTIQHGIAFSVQGVL